MALTDNCDAFGSVHEDGFNRVAMHVMRQRPSLFNYGTQMFAANPELLCARIEAHPEVTRRGNPLITVEDPLPVVGTSGLLGMNFCVQLSELQIDFHPSSEFELPPELGRRLDSQHLAIHARFCAGIACPDERVQEQLGDVIAVLLPALVSVGGKGTPTIHRPREPELPDTIPIPARKVLCFCLDVFAVAHSEWVGSGNATRLALRLDGIEIVDIEPENLENSLECYVATTLRVGILPRIRISLDTLIYKLGEFATLAISPTPLTAVPNNPAIEEDEIRAFIDVAVT